MSIEIIIQNEQVPPIEIGGETVMQIEVPTQQNAVIGVGLGNTGKSAYEDWLADGNVGTKQDFYESSVVGQNTTDLLLNYQITQL